MPERKRWTSPIFDPFWMPGSGVSLTTRRSSSRLPLEAKRLGCLGAAVRWRASGWERPGDGLPVSTCPSSVSRRVGITSTRWVSTWLLVPGATARLNHDSAQAASRTEPPLGAWSNRRGAVEATYDRRGRHDLNQHALLSERFGVLITFFKSSPG